MNELNTVKQKKQPVATAKVERSEQPVKREVKAVKSAKPSYTEEVLVDKTNVVSKPVERTNKAVESEITTSSLPDYKVHSIFSGRVWLKNSDGTLATYQEGERLPSGELIKKINTETFSVETDKRKIIR